ncbi:helix-turn-helix domain-containing protein [Streptomyces sp. NPDC127063]|uniref:helix-turn-helix domain-containing protein n=1 Tax=Streptomyces sp. NPDC127063 TaxID=3347123 RepID=UPI00366990D0
MRLLSNSHQSSAAEILEFAVRVQRRTEAVTAGVVLLARRRRIPWEALGQILSISPETARHNFHERVVQRRLDAYAPGHQPSQAQAVDPAEGTDEGPDDAPTGQPPQPSRRATSQLAPVLSRLQIVSGIPLRQLGLRTQVSASYLSRVLSGEKFPTWELTEKLALALGADSQALRKVWEDERQRNGIRSRRPHREAPPAGEPEGTSLSAGLRTLHQRAGSPSPHHLAAAAGHVVTPDDICRIFHGETTGTWEQVAALIHALDGEPSFFKPVWEEAHRAAPPSAAPSPRLSETPTHRLNRILATFSDALDTRALPPSPTITSRQRTLRRRLALAARSQASCTPGH